MAVSHVRRICQSVRRSFRKKFRGTISLFLFATEEEVSAHTNEVD